MKIPKIIQLPSGAYNTNIMIDGQRISITDYSEELVAAKALALKTGLTKRTPPSKLTVKQACERYIDERRGRLSPTTIDGYERIVANGFPQLMKMQIGDITHRTLQKAVDDECKRVNQRGQKYSPKSVTNRYTFIASVLHDYTDIRTDVVLPDIKDKPIILPTAEEIYQAVKGTPIELPVLLSMWLTLSMSEIRGLTKSKSIHGDKLSVVETVVQVDGKDVRKTGGKEQKRSRTLAIPKYIKKLIDNVDGDVIVSATPASITSRFYKLLKKNGIPHISFHALRHISASTMAMLQIQPEISNQRGGWKTSYTRERVYTHVFTRERIEADKKIDEYFNRITDGITDENQKVP